jgi:hypothetical protein
MRNVSMSHKATLLFRSYFKSLTSYLCNETDSQMSGKKFFGGSIVWISPWKLTLTVMDTSERSLKQNGSWFAENGKTVCLIMLFRKRCLKLDTEPVSGSSYRHIVQRRQLFLQFDPLFRLVFQRITLSRRDKHPSCRRQYRGLQSTTSIVKMFFKSAISAVASHNEAATCFQTVVCSQKNETCQIYNSKEW